MLWKSHTVILGFTCISVRNCWKENHLQRSLGAQTTVHFLCQCFGLAPGGGSGWGVWGIEVLFLFTTVLLSFLTLRHKIKPIASLLLIIATYMASYQYMSGNFTEEYALVLQAAILFIFLSQHFKAMS